MNGKHSAEMKSPQAGLRERAERVCKEGHVRVLALPPEELQRLLHELQVHQVELEMQNHELLKAHEELAHSRDRLDYLYDFAPVGYLTLDKDGKILEANLTAATMLRLERSELVGKKFSQFVALQSQDDFYRHQRCICSSEEKQACELVIRRKDGTIFHAQLESVRSKEPYEEVTTCSTVISDITARVESEYLTASVFDAMAPHIAILDGKGKIIRVNKTWERFAIENGGASFFVGENYVEVCRHALGRETAEAARAMKGLMRVLSRTVPEFRMEYECSSPTQKRWFLMTASAMVQGVAGAIVVHQDITEHHLADEKRRLLAGIVESSKDAVFSVTPDLLVTSWNSAAERLYGYSAEEVLGKSIKLFFPEDRSDDLRSLTDVASGTQPFSEREATLRTKDGRMVEVVRSVSPMKNDSGDIVGVSVVSRDITIRKQAELGVATLLRQSLADEERLRALFEGVPNGIVVVDASGVIKSVNSCAEEMFGYSQGEMIGKPVEILVPPRFLDLHASYCANFMRKPETRSMGQGRNLTALRKDGSEFPAEIGLSPARTDEGLFIVTTVTDITERKRAEGALAKSESQLQSILNNTTAVIYVKDKEGRYLRVNSRFEELFHVTQEKILGQTDYDRFPKQIADAFRANDLRVLETGTALQTEETVPQDDGIHTYISVKFPLRDGSGAPYAICGLSTDITERKRAESALQASKDLFDLVMRATNDGIWDWDLTTNEVYFSPRWKSMLGYEEHEIKNTFEEWEKRIHPDDRARALETIRVYLEEETESYRLEHRLMHKNGEYRWILARGVALRDEAGKAYRLVGSHVDLTDRKRLEQEILEISDFERQRIGQELHDDICQSLAGLSMLSSLLHARIADKKLTEAKDAQKICETARELILKGRTLATGLSPLNVAGKNFEVALTELAESVQALFKVPCVLKFGHQLAIEDNTAATHVYRIVQEAVHNAAKHSKAKKIGISIRKKDSEVVVTVTDDGIGFDPNTASAGMGQRMMRYRAHAIQAGLDIQSKAGSGTKVILTIHSDFAR